MKILYENIFIEFHSHKLKLLYSNLIDIFFIDISNLRFTGHQSNSHHILYLSIKHPSRWLALLKLISIKP